MTENSTKVQVLQAVGGGVAGACTRFVCQPFDVLKIRFQLQVEPVKGSHESSKYRGMLQALSSIYKEEGLRGVWRGHNSGQVMSITYAFVQFWSYERLKILANRTEFFSNRPLLTFFMCGGLAGCLGTIASQPFDIIRTMIVASDAHSRSSKVDIFSGVYKIIQKKGLLGLTRGLPFTLVQVFPLVGANFLIYKFLNETVIVAHERITKKPNPQRTIPGFILFMNGALAGVGAKVLVYPADVVKKRIQLSVFEDERKSFGRNPICPSFVQCVASTYRVEGISGFYKGMSPTLFKSGLTTAFYFTVYDHFNRWFIRPLRESAESNKTGKKRGK
ncbi:mitochondrial thiamine pyrophosphate carrier [Drosophila tropicalis]|uniref:mitochondrial thiamine pyrophosphate carrier n=1 Tax=Drosophila tropicalis TaxID=46794 RepID=UPI0035AC117A